MLVKYLQKYVRVGVPRTRTECVEILLRRKFPETTRLLSTVINFVTTMTTPLPWNFTPLIT